MLTKFVVLDWRQKLRSDIAPGVAWNGARRLLDRIAILQLNFSWIVSMMLNRRGLLQRRGDAFVDFRQSRRPAAGALHGSRQDVAFSLDGVEEGLTHRPLALKRTHRLYLPGRFLGGQLVLGRPSSSSSSSSS